MTMNFSRRLTIPTEVATIVIFHPDDLAHAKDWPIAWYAEPFVYPVESEAGRLIAWTTGFDGSFGVRLTNGSLSNREDLYAGPSWEFPFTVRHGRVFLDNTDTLPGAEQMDQTTDNEDFWIDVPNGEYAVKVTGIEWQAEPGSEGEDFDLLPNYVVQFIKGAATNVRAARRPPDIISRMDGISCDKILEYPADRFDFDPQAWHPGFISTEIMPVGNCFSSQGEAHVEAAQNPHGDAFDLFDVSFIVCTRLEIGAPAVIATLSGTSSRKGGETEYEFFSRRLVKISRIDGMFHAGRHMPLPKQRLFLRKTGPLPPDAMAAIQVESWQEENDEVPQVEPLELRQAIQSSFEPSGVFGQLLAGKANFESLRIGGFESIDDMAAWLLLHLPMTAKERIEIMAMPINRRVKALRDVFDRQVATGL